MKPGRGQAVIYRPGATGVWVPLAPLPWEGVAISCCLPHPFFFGLFPVNEPDKGGLKLCTSHFLLLKFQSVLSSGCKWLSSATEELRCLSALGAWLCVTPREPRSLGPCGPPGGGLGPDARAVPGAGRRRQSKALCAASENVRFKRPGLTPRPPSKNNPASGLLLSSENKFIHFFPGAVCTRVCAFMACLLAARSCSCW